MPSQDDLERIYAQIDKEYTSKLTPEQKEELEKARKKKDEIMRSLKESVIKDLPTAKDFLESRFQKAFIYLSRMEAPSLQKHYNGKLVYQTP